MHQQQQHRGGAGDGPRHQPHGHGQQHGAHHAADCSV
jgi:hypothetical protein